MGVRPQKWGQTPGCLKGGWEQPCPTDEHCPGSTEGRGWEESGPRKHSARIPESRQKTGRIMHPTLKGPPESAPNKPPVQLAGVPQMLAPPPTPGAWSLEQ